MSRQTANERATAAGATPPVRNVGAWVLVALLAVATLISVFSLVYGTGNGGEFEGADGQAEGVITEIVPDYEPWFEPVIGELPGEVESGLFALQAAIGAGVVGYAFGVLRTRTRQRNRPGRAADRR